MLWRQSSPAAIHRMVTHSAGLQDGRQTVWLSKVDKAPQMTFCEDRLTITSRKGYRMVSSYCSLLFDCR